MFDDPDTTAGWIALILLFAVCCFSCDSDKEKTETISYHKNYVLIEGTPFDLSTVEAIGELRQDGYSVPRGYYLRFIDDLPITGEEFCYTEALRLPDDIDYDDYLELYARWLGVKDGVTFKEDPDASVRHYLKLAEQALAESRKDLQEERTYE